MRACAQATSLTAVNDESLSADSCQEANMRLLEFMKASRKATC